MGTKKQKKTDISQLLAALVMCLVGAACGILMMKTIRGSVPKDASLIKSIVMVAALLVLFYAAFVLQTIIHEGGHLVFGLLTGYRFCSFRIFNLMWIRGKEGIRFKRLSLAGTGGQCLMAFPETEDGKIPTNIPVLLYNYGGVIMNLVTAAIAGGLAFACREGSVIRTFLIFLAVIGVAFALLNGLPLKMSAVSNDGRNALDLMKDPEARRAFWIQMKVNELASRDIRVKDMPKEWFSVPSEQEMQNGITAMLGPLAAGRLMDEQCFAEADALMKRFLEGKNGIAGLNRGLLGNDRMYLELIGENRPEVLKAMKTPEQMKIMRAMKNYLSILRTEYAYALLAEKDGENAKKILRVFEKSARTYPYPGEVEAERELIAIAQNKVVVEEVDDTEDKDVSSVSEDAPVSGK